MTVVDVGMWLRIDRLLKNERMSGDGVNAHKVQGGQIRMAVGISQNAFGEKLPGVKWPREIAGEYFRACRVAYSN